MKIKKWRKWLVFGCAVFGAISTAAVAESLWPTNGIGDYTIQLALFKAPAVSISADARYDLITESSSSPILTNIFEDDSFSSFSSWSNLLSGDIPKVWITGPEKTDENVFPLPFADKMDLDTVYSYTPNKWGSDTFFWRLVPVGKQSDIGSFVTSDYPLNLIGPQKDSISVGIGFTLRFW
ncbi:MAG: hypothetical protein NTZ38_00355 [Candidatus Taylorbacteria bacterium]|nr:hypothetical protein [Candidatus Taylorbacteria bacterium]